MSYFDYLTQNVEPIDTQCHKIIQGTCLTMCSEDEMNIRLKEHMVHKLEFIGINRKLIKSYSRSAADSNMAVPKNLRPYKVLLETVQYLLSEVTKRKDVGVAIIFDFVNDRLRAIRQEMTIQQLPPEQCMNLLEPMVRFHVFYGYRLSEYPIREFDPVLNKKYLLECLKWFLSSSDMEKNNINYKIQETTNFFSKMNIEIKTANILNCDCVLMENLYILCNLDFVHPLYRYFTLKKDIKRLPSMELAYNIAISNLSGHYAKVCAAIRKLSLLSYCALVIYLPEVQKNALKVMSHAYSSKHLKVPLHVVRDWLAFSSNDEAKKACEHYGLVVEGDAVRFGKDLFKTDVQLHQPMKPYTAKDLDFESVLSYSVDTS